MPAFGDRLKKVREECGETVRDFADRLGVARQTIYDWYDLEEPSQKALGALVSAYPTLNVEWLKTGQGQMLLSGQDNGEKELPAEVEREARSFTDEELRERGLYRVPDVEVDAGPGREPILEKTNGEEILPGWYIRQEFGVAPDRLVRARITGDSMKDTLQPGQRVWAARWEGELLKDGAIYMIYGPHGLQVKRLIFDEKKSEDAGEPVPMIWIWSDNEERPRIRVTRERFEADYQVLAWLLMKNSYL